MFCTNNGVRERAMRVIRLPEVLSQVLSERKPALLVGTSAARAVVIPIDEYERLVALNDWHERMLKGA
jgi:PHD/YefM family antitoxin component YafN of YafNO toxin-antitoxin module